LKDILNTKNEKTPAIAAHALGIPQLPGFQFFYSESFKTVVLKSFSASCFCSF